MSILIGVVILFGIVIIAYGSVRILRGFYKFPIPQFLTQLIDNPLRWKIQSPECLNRRHKIQPGKRILEIGPGKGTLTLASAEVIGSDGLLVAVDIDLRIMRRLYKRVREEDRSNIKMMQADALNLPFAARSFDGIFLVAVFGELPLPDQALIEFHRVLDDAGSLAFTELISDPDYSRPSSLIKLAASAGFNPGQRFGSILSYTQVFEKDEPNDISDLAPIQ